MNWIYPLILLFGVSIGWTANGWRLNGDITDMKLDIANQAETLRLAAQKRINTIDSKGAARTKKQAATDQSLLAKVETNVPNTLPLLPGSFRVQHDADATGEEIVDSRTADARPVAPKDVARTVSANYADARSDKERLRELQAIVRASGCFDLEP